MNRPVLFRNAVVVTARFLRARFDDDGLDDVPIVRRVPDPRPSRFVLIRRVGGIRQTLVSDAATLVFECWGDDEDQAHDLAQLVRMWVLDIGGYVDDEGPVYRATELAGPGRLPDPLSDQERYTFTASVHLRGRTYAADTSE